MVVFGIDAHRYACGGGADVYADDVSHAPDVSFVDTSGTQRDTD